MNFALRSFQVLDRFIRHIPNERVLFLNLSNRGQHRAKICGNLAFDEASYRFKSDISFWRRRWSPISGHFLRQSGKEWVRTWLFWLLSSCCFCSLVAAAMVIIVGRGRSASLLQGTACAKPGRWRSNRLQTDARRLRI